MLGDRAVPEAEDNPLVALARLFDFLTRHRPELIDGPGVAADARVGGADGFGGQVVFFEELGGAAMKFRRLGAQLLLAHRCEPLFGELIRHGPQNPALEFPENLDIDIMSGEKNPHEAYDLRGVR